MSSSQAHYLQIIARAAPISDRMQCSGFSVWPDIQEGTVEKRLDHWVKMVASGDKARFDAYLAVRGLSREQIQRGISDVVVNDVASLPRWAKVFLDLMNSFADRRIDIEEAQAQYAEETPGNIFAQLLAPFLEIGAADLHEIIAAQGLSIAPQARTEIVGLLGSRLSSVVIHIIDHELQTHLSLSSFLQQMGVKTHSQLDSTYDGWMARLDRYPVLAYLLSITYMHWHDLIVELLAHLNTDFTLIENRLFDGARLGPLKRFEGDVGDVHDRGRAVALLTFEVGKCVYKPKNLQISAGFMDLVSFLNTSETMPALHVRQILARDGYAWEEFVAHSACDNQDQVRRFYYRFGMMVRLLQLLGARDFWLDNLIACGEQPAFIDLEMVVQPPMAIPNRLLPAEALAFSLLQESAVPSGMIAQCTPLGQGIQAEDLGALTPQRTFRTPFKLSYSVPMRALLAPELGDGEHSSWSKIGYTPVLNDSPVLAVDYLEEFLAGYQAMQVCLQQNKDALLSASGPLLTLANNPIRHIHRDTWSCIQIIHDSLRPACLVDGIWRDLFLESLSRKFVSADSIDTHLLKMTESEIEAFRRLDVPLFQTLPSKTDVLLDTGDIIQEYFHESALSRIKQRLSLIEGFNCEKEIDLIRSNFSTGPHRTPSRLSLNNSRSSSTIRFDKDDCITQAITIGDFVLAQGITSGKSDKAWLGLTYLPDIDMHSLDVLRPDLLSGTCGLAILFGELFAITRLPRFHEAASFALAATRRQIEGRHLLWDQLEQASFSRGALFCGGYYGIGAQIYTLRRCAVTLEEPELARIASRCVRTLPIPLIWQKAPLDLISGSAGFLLSVLPVAWEHSAFEAPESVATLTGYFLAALTLASQQHSSPYPQDALLIKHLIGQEGGIALCLARSLAKQPSLGDASDEAARLVASIAKDLAASAPTASNLLVRMALAQIGNQPRATLQQEVSSYLEADFQQSTSLEVLNLLDLSLTARDMFGDQSFASTAYQAAAELHYRSHQCGSWFPDGFAADRHNLSAITGVAAIGLQFLRLAAQASIPSLRLLE